MKTAIVTCAWGPTYEKGFTRLQNSLADFGGVDLVRGDAGDGHATLPYAFKHRALREVERLGYDAAIWCDSNAHWQHHPERMIQRIKRQGYWICTLGWNVGQWCTDEALPKLDITREQAWKIDMVCAAVYGLRFDRPQAQEVLKYLEDHEDAMPGPWTNDNNGASATEGVMGHRHDQTVLSVAAKKVGLEIDRPPCLLAYAYNNGVYEQQAIVHKEGVL